MRRKTITRGARLSLTAGCTAVATFGLVSGAHALWSVNDAVVIPAYQIGAVTFAAAAPESESLTYSQDGGPVTLTLPAAEIMKVLQQTGVDAPPVFWSFEVSGQANGIAGLVYDVAMTQQVGRTGKVYDLGSGIADENTILHYSTLKLYPASISGDCSTVPETPEIAEGETAKNIYQYDVEGHVLQSPGATADSAIAYDPDSSLIVQKWCVAMDFNNDLDGQYINDAQVTGIGENGVPHGALDTWQAAVAFPPSLPPLGEYYNKAFVQGLAEDETWSRDEDEWSSILYPDPSNEPSVTITLDPAVTNQNPNVEQPSDHFALSDDS